ncbi:FTR1 family iron permease [Psychrobacter lutiphocae]|uniref:FTR1 family iron permease n=1 Tax=Psychrobacter lutiphocae TaxID=540500 RepID=UPI000365F6E5|nr:FTR1 family protein [Psychrobacter lutiphocae]
MGQVIFVVARECVEALLVIGILWAWMSQDKHTQQGKKWLLGGIVAGIGLAVLLALALVGITTFLGAMAQQWFEIIMLTFASVLIVQMVYWMRQHGKSLKSDLENELAQNAKKANWWGVFFLAMIAVGREGSETVMFLYGSFLSLQSVTDYLSFGASVSIGLILAFILFYLLQVGERFISWRIFFSVTEILLLFLGASLILTAAEKLMGGPMATLDLPSWLYSSVWDTGAILDDSGLFGNLLASLFAYRSRPIGFDIVILALYWSVVIGLLLYQKNHASQTTYIKKVG